VQRSTIRLEPGAGALPLASNSERFVCATILAAYKEAARAIDIDPFSFLRRARLPLDGEDSGELKIPYRRLLELISSTAEAAGVPDLALTVVEALRPSSFGVVGLLAGAQPTMLDGLDVIRRYWRRQDDGVRLVITVSGETACVRLVLSSRAGCKPLPPSKLPLGVLLRAIQSIVGSDWRPAQTAFVKEAPTCLGRFLEVFGPVTFGAPFNSITFPAEDLSRPLPHANPILAKVLEEQLGARVEPRPVADWLSEVRGVVEVLLPTGNCSVHCVAGYLGVERRTVHRRLAEVGETFSSIVQATRLRLAAAHRREGAGRLADLSTRLGFSSQSVFSRWFRQTYGVSASRWMRLQQPDGRHVS
jgi:AraC-like DNA-binding protein